MPEGPEITAIARVLDLRLAAQALREIRIVSGPYKNHRHARYAELRNSVREINSFARRADNAVRIAHVRNHGKYMWMELQLLHTERKKLQLVRTVYLASTWGLTGHWSFANSQYMRVEIKFAAMPHTGEPTSVYYSDKLQFGNLHILEPEAHAQRIAELGPDIYELRLRDFLQRYAREAQARPKFALHRLLMQGAFIAGIGNYLRAEILYDAQHAFNPLAQIGALDMQQQRQLYASIVSCARRFLGIYDPRSGEIKVRSGFCVYNRKTTPRGEKITSRRDADGRKFWYVPHANFKLN